MRNLALVWVLAGCLLGCGGREAKDKATVADTVDTVAVVADTAVAVADTDSTFTDTRDGKTYKIVKIGNQTWFAENLNYAAKGSVCYDNEDANCAKYGRLYDWNTAMKACPVGTHLPTDKEWDTLVNYVGGGKKAGTKLRSSTGWDDYEGESGNGTNEYGFLALPGGFSHDVSFYYAGHNSFWWSATEFGADHAWSRSMYYNNKMSEMYIENLMGKMVGSGNNYKMYLFSVRCVQDNEKERRK
jgi:uncharacterized protein (TIGR02145 family)